MSSLAIAIAGRGRLTARLGFCRWRERQKRKNCKGENKSGTLHRNLHQ